MPKAPSPAKAQVEIEQKPQTPQEQAAAELMKRLEKPVQPPPIEETLEKAKQASDQAMKARTKVRNTWYCSECGNAHIQLYLGRDGSGHFSVEEDDGVPVNPDGTPLTGKELSSAQQGRLRGGGSGKSKNQHI